MVSNPGIDPSLIKQKFKEIIDEYNSHNTNSKVEMTDQGIFFVINDVRNYFKNLPRKTEFEANDDYITIRIPVEEIIALAMEKGNTPDLKSLVGEHQVLQDSNGQIKIVIKLRL
jgi:hypothetical protein